MNMSRKIFSVAFATLAALPSFAADYVAPWEEMRVATRTVQIADLDLTTTSGQKALHQRLRRAARQVCDELEPMEPGRQMAHGLCVSEVLDDTLASLPVAIAEPARRLAGRSKLLR